MSDAPHGYRWSSYAMAVFLNGLVFALAGPAIGAVFSPGVMVLPIAVILAYYTSTIPAFVTGCCVAVASSFIAESKKLYLFAAFTGATLGGGLPAALLGAQVGTYGFWVVIHVIAGGVAAVICTRITRTMRLNAGAAFWRA